MCDAKTGACDPTQAAAALLDELARTDSPSAPTAVEALEAAARANKPRRQDADSDLPIAERKRRAVFLTDVDPKGELISAETGPVRLNPMLTRVGAAVLVLAALMAYFVLGAPSLPRRRAVSTQPAPAGSMDTPGSAVVATSGPAPAPAAFPGVAPAVPAAESHPPEGRSWACLVQTCGGDAARAGAIINGIVAADPTVAAHSEEALVRALKLVRG